ncbi:hypothetical protein [Curtobacterium sp. 18060]|nr:hypothetical protein [Curtobacterium sp. 18060]
MSASIKVTTIPTHVVVWNFLRLVPIGRWLLGRCEGIAAPW